MSEKEWVESIIGDIQNNLQSCLGGSIEVVSGFKLSYSNEILSYRQDGIAEDVRTVKYETDIIIKEIINNDSWKPRVIIETKLGSITTHDAITYSQKANTQKQVHPYLRYGILIGKREHYPLPDRLFRHGQNFDFMQSWKGETALESEMVTLIDILVKEIQASRFLEEIIFNSRSKDRERFTSLHRPLILSQ
jgi:hypothetical protein